MPRPDLPACNCEDRGIVVEFKEKKDPKNETHTFRIPAPDKPEEYMMR